MRIAAFLFTAICFSFLFPDSGAGMRVATYNLQWLDIEDTSGGERLDNLKEVIRKLNADVIGIQEAADRKALEGVFPPDEWSLLIDDESWDKQDLAFAVRKPLKIIGKSDDPDGPLNADDGDFLFPGKEHNDSFPNRRDVLVCRIMPPDAKFSLAVLNHHAKSRVGGRHKTEPRRIEASRLILRETKARFANQLFILLGDFNDTPDDASLNVLETGDEAAQVEMDSKVGPWLHNLTEALAAQDMVSQGRSGRDIRDGRLNLIDPGSREENLKLYGSNERSRKDFLPDQMLIPPEMLRYCPGRKAVIFSDPCAVRGNSETRASDHLPVFADFNFQAYTAPHASNAQ